jgi:hypothetical protein
MIRAFVDVDAKLLDEYLERVNHKRHVCKVLPAARFAIDSDGTMFLETLVCRGMGRLSTGTSAEYCQNCVTGEGR